MLAVADPADISLVVTPEPHPAVLAAAAPAMKAPPQVLAVMEATISAAVVAAVLLDQQLVVPVVKVF
jgi:hypothetical protein